MTRLVLLHGLLGGPRSFDALRTLLPLQTHEPPLPGHHGGREPPARFEDAVDTLAAELREALGEGPFDVLGYSLGARVALGLCARHPASVRRALLVSVHPGLRTEADRDARRAEDERWARLAEREGMTALVDAWERHPVFASQASLSPEARAAQRSIRLSHDGAAIARAIRALGLGAMPDYVGVLDEQAPRITLVVGGRDEKFSALARARRAPVERIPDAGHNPLLEAPALLASVIVRTLKEASA